MFLLILLSPLLLLACWVLPLLGTLFAKQNTEKWVAFWILSIVLSYTLYPLLELVLDCEYVMIIHIVVTLAMMALLSQ